MRGVCFVGRLNGIDARLSTDKKLIKEKKGMCEHVLANCRKNESLFSGVVKIISFSDEFNRRNKKKT